MRYLILSQELFFCEGALSEDAAPAATAAAATAVVAATRLRLRLRLSLFRARDEASPAELAQGTARCR